MSGHKIQLSIKVQNDELKDASLKAFHQFGVLMVNTRAAPFFELTSTSDLGVVESDIPKPPKIKWHMPYQHDGTFEREPEPTLPVDWALPRVGDEITLSNARTLLVKHVVLFPHGNEDGSEPFVYIVLTKRVQIDGRL